VPNRFTDPILSLHPKKSFGQNFLVQRSAIEGIVKAALVSPAERLLEIGPGPGVLTEPLLGDGRPLWAIDLDPEACAVMEGRFGSLSHFHLIHGDAVKVPLPEGAPWSVVGNLPYNAATAILTRFLVEPIPWERMVLMFQLEVGQKLMGKPGEKAYGPLSILAQLTTRVTRLMKLGPGAFRPAPKVDSVVLLFEPRAEAPDHALRRELLALLHRSFAHRRKTLANNWQSWMKADDIAAILEREGLPAAVRAEAIPPQTWLSILKGVAPFFARLHDPIDETL
jgi:16S rRNA (adenine1518-N6/adenine1519-N6)-dimethyltransferase